LILLERQNGRFQLTWLAKTNPLPMCHICHRILNDKNKGYLLTDDSFEFFSCKKCIRHGNTNPEKNLSLLWDNDFVNSKVRHKSIIPVSIELMI